jgi:predicted alpha/beta hydrolase family esterase
MKCIIVHGCPSDEEKTMSSEQRSYDKHWIPWIKKELEARGVHVEVPLMPNPWEPVYEAFKKEFEKISITNDDVLVGHSCACAFLVRWLGETKQKIGKLILVAPWKTWDSDDTVREDFYDYPVDVSIRQRVGRTVIFTASDEDEDGKKDALKFNEALDGRLIELEGKGHYIFKDMETEEFPELLEEIIVT